MLKNFLLSKISVLTLTAVVLNSLIAPAWSMEEEKEKNPNSNFTITVKNSNDAEENENSNVATVKKSSYVYVPGKIQDLPPEVLTSILEMAAFDVGAENKLLSNLALVCQLWEGIVNNENESIKKAIQNAWDGGRCDWVYKQYNITDPEHKAVFGQFYKGQLIYRPIEGNDEGIVTLRISDLRNPLEGTFDLSSCGDTGKYLSIATGYRKGKTPSNANKVEIWFTPRFLVDKEMPQLAPNHHIRTISGNWDASRAPIGIFWTWGGWDASNQLAYCDYLTTESMDLIGSENLLKKYEKGRNSAFDTPMHRLPPLHGLLRIKKFHISFVN